MDYTINEDPHAEETIIERQGGVAGSWVKVATHTGNDRNAAALDVARTLAKRNGLTYRVRQVSTLDVIEGTQA